MRGLYAITDSVLLSDGKLLPYVQAALQGGARLLQYRDKSKDSAKRLDEAQALAELCHAHDCQLIINDDLRLADQLKVGLHLGQTDGCLAEARAQLGPHTIIGATCHASLALADQAVEQGASYLAFGRFFNSNTKPGAPAADVTLLKHAHARFDLPLVAIGGITLQNAPTLLQGGADLVAVIHGLFGAANDTEVQQRARAFRALF